MTLAAKNLEIFRNQLRKTVPEVLEVRFDIVPDGKFPIQVTMIFYDDTAVCTRYPFEEMQRIPRLCADSAWRGLLVWGDKQRYVSGRTAAVMAELSTKHIRQEHYEGAWFDRNRCPMCDDFHIGSDVNAVLRFHAEQGAS